MNLKAVLAIFKKDLRDGRKNYQVVLMVLTPIILSLLFSNVITKSKSEIALPEIGVITNPKQPLINSMVEKGLGKKIKFYQKRKDLESAILEGKVRFGIILPEIISTRTNFDENDAIILLYPPHIPEFGIESLKTAFESEIRQQLNLQPPALPFRFLTEPVSGNTNKGGGMTEGMFPMLIVMAIGMTGFLALPMSIVEEREKGTLNAIFLTPLKTSEFIFGKSLFSFFLATFTILMILTLNNKWGENFHYLLAFCFSGTLMTIFIGLIISLFAKNQGSVNAIGTTVFLFFQMIPNLQHTSELFNSIAPIIPSTYLFNGLRKAMFLDLSKVDISSDFFTVAAITLLAYIISFVLFKLKKADK